MSAIKAALQGALMGVGICLVCVGLITVLNWFVPRDSTDGPERRSGMALYTDAGTGCQYVGASGGLTPRLDFEGKPMCTKGPNQKGGQP